MEKMELFKKIKNSEPKNFRHYKKLTAYVREIQRLNCVLVKGMVSQKMFDTLTLKLATLEREWVDLNKIIIMNPFKEGKFKKYHIDFVAYCNEEEEKIIKKFKFNKCAWCGSLIDYRDDDFCPDEYCDSHDFE